MSLPQATGITRSNRRGVLFAPMNVPSAAYSRPGFRLTPSITISLGALTANLFVSPRDSHYYVGRLLRSLVRPAGIYPQYQSETHHTSYDPIYTQARWLHHDNLAGWERQEQQQYSQRLNNVQLRPAKTYTQEQARVARLPEPQRRHGRDGQPLAAVVRQPTKAIRFERTTPAPSAW